MPKNLLVSLVILLTFHLSICPFAFAGNLTINKANSRFMQLSGDADVRHVGKVKLPTGVAVVQDNRIEILFDS